MYPNFAFVGLALIDWGTSGGNITVSWASELFQHSSLGFEFLSEPKGFNKLKSKYDFKKYLDFQWMSIDCNWNSPSWKSAQIRGIPHLWECCTLTQFLHKLQCNHCGRYILISITLITSFLNLFQTNCCLQKKLSQHVLGSKGIPFACSRSEKLIYGRSIFDLLPKYLHLQKDLLLCHFYVVNTFQFSFINSGLWSAWCAYMVRLGKAFEKSRHPLNFIWISE